MKQQPTSAPKHDLPTLRPRSRRRFSREQKLDFLRRWADSGLSRLAFCRKERLTYSSFLRWSEQFSPTAAETKNHPAKPGPWLEVEVRDHRPEEPNQCEIVAPNGWRIRWAAGHGLGALSQLLEVIGQC